MTETATESPRTSEAAVTSEEYLRLDEKLLREGRETTRVAVLSGPALSIGVSQRENAPCVVRARRLGIPVVRRSTGGLGLSHGPGDLVWSLILPRSEPRVGNDFSRAYARLGAGVVRFLAETGVTAAWQPPRGPPCEHCLLAGRGDVLRVGDRALGGAPQHATREALLHHGVLPYRLEVSKLAELFDLSPVVVEGSLTGLERVTGGIPPGVLAQRLRTVLESERGVVPV